MTTYSGYGPSIQTKTCAYCAGNEGSLGHAGAGAQWSTMTQSSERRGLND
jgi:hypothetical protein